MAKLTVTSSSSGTTFPPNSSPSGSTRSKSVKETLNLSSSSSSPSPSSENTITCGNLSEVKGSSKSSFFLSHDKENRMQQKAIIILVFMFCFLIITNRILSQVLPTSYK